MNHRKSEKRLTFERLESMELLSGAGALASAAHEHPMVRAHGVDRGLTPDTALNLSGTVQGTFRAAAGGTARVVGRGMISPVGKAHVQATIGFSSSGGGGQLTLNFGRRGKVFAAVTGRTLVGSYNYQITGGTKMFAGDGGSGVAAVSIPSANGTMSRGRFALTFQGA